MGNLQQEKEKEIKAQQLAERVMKSVQQEIVSYMPYLNRAVLHMPVLFYTPEEGKMEQAVSFGTDGQNFYALASIVMQMFEQSSNQVIRLYLHSIMHCLFSHMFTYERLNTQYWDLAADIAAENVILSLDWPRCEIDGDDIRRQYLAKTIDVCGKGNAETIYAYLCTHEKERDEMLRRAFMFRQDRHDVWAQDQKNKQDTKELDHQWQDIKKNTAMDVESYERRRGKEAGNLSRLFRMPVHQAQDYTSFLQKFAVQQEELKSDIDSFDYIYYTYGLRLYEKMPLIEPLEYRIDKHIHTFVIAIDTSGSTQGELVRSFLMKTYDILHASGVFAETMQVLILQCDAKIQQETIICDPQELDAYVKDLKILGGGGTDFRPVFTRIEELQKEKTLTNIQGLIYFTDGHGEYPKSMPSYKTAFVMIENTEQVPAVPSWAIRYLVPMEELER